MSVNRHLSRTLAMQTLYEWDFRNGIPIQDIVRRNIDIYKDDVDKEYVITCVEGVKKEINDIDKAIVKYAPEFPIDQISNIDKSILRLAIYELLYNEEVPAKVAINEAVELGKLFGNDSSYKFINGVLGAVYRNSPKYNPDDEKEIVIEEESPETNNDNDE